MIPHRSWQFEEEYKGNKVGDSHSHMEKYVTYLKNETLGWSSIQDPPYGWFNSGDNENKNWLTRWLEKNRF